MVGGVQVDGIVDRIIFACRSYKVAAEKAAAADPPFDAAFQSRLATRIINQVQGINRAVYDYTSKPPGTIEWE